MKPLKQTFIEGLKMEITDEEEIHLWGERGTRKHTLDRFTLELDTTDYGVTRSFFVIEESR